MKDLQKTSFAPMSAEERSKLKRGLYFMPFFVVFASGVFYFMFSMSSGENSFLWGIGLMGFAFIGIIIWVVRSIYLDLRDNEKKIVQGVITRKEKIVSRGTRSGSSRHSRRSRTNRTYIFYFGDTKMKVQANLYNQFEEGDFVEIHMAKRALNVIFKSIKIDSGQMMDVVAEQKAAAVEDKKGMTVKMGLLFIVLIPIVFTVFFIGISDCFNCANTYPASVTEWKHFRAKKSLTHPVEERAEQIIGYLNDELFDEEEEDIQTIFYHATQDGHAAELVRYLHQKEIGDTRTALDWLMLKHDEQLNIDRPLSAVEIWKRTIYSFWPNDYFPPAFVYQQNNAKLKDLHQIMMSRGGLDYTLAKAWFGNRNSKQEWQRITKELIPDDASLHTAGINEFMKEVWGGDFLLEETEREFHEKAKRVYGLK